jgi:DNA/RNA endonuclease YhcR with UshA esterase domain
MEKEEKVVVVLLLMVLSSLLTAYLCFGSDLEGAGQTSGGETRKYTQESVTGKKVTLEAEVLNKRFTHKGDHLILQVDCNSEVLSVFIPKTAGAESVNLSVSEGDLISVTGTILEYEGKKEIKVEKEEDIIVRGTSKTDSK